MEYQEFDVENFAMDDYFIKWVKKPDEASDLFWSSWVHRHPEKKEIVERAKRMVIFMDMEAEELPEFEIHQLWEKIKYEVKKEEQAPKFNFTYMSTVRKNMYLQKYAAVFLGILIISVSAWFLTSTTQIYETDYGKTLTISLPDGSTAILNANSKLKFNKKWTESVSREVWLDGEAFFKVLKKKTRGNAKFIVHANELNVEVLGTEFNVINRRGKAKVVLNSGKIKIIASEINDTEGFVMNPGELVEFDSQSKKLEKREVDPEIFSSWKNNKLIFYNTSLREIALLIKDNYGFEVIMSEEITKRKLTGEVEVSNIDDLISAVSESLGLKITKKDYKIIIEE